jgi:hypothetical protein
MEGPRGHGADYGVAVNMDKIVQASLDAQAGNMRRQVMHVVAEAAKRAGFR